MHNVDVLGNIWPSGCHGPLTSQDDMWPLRYCNTQKKSKRKDKQAKFVFIHLCNRITEVNHCVS